jgi:hypothetical protein
MFVVEISVLILFIGGFCVWLLLTDRIGEWRARREADRVSSFVNDLRGNEIADILKRFGPPREQFTGSSGRSLYVWQSPPSNELPRVRDGLLVLMLTVDEDGMVSETVWHRR